MLSAETRAQMLYAVGLIAVAWMIASAFISMMLPHNFEVVCAEKMIIPQSSPASPLQQACTERMAHEKPGLATVEDYFGSTRAPWWSYALFAIGALAALGAPRLRFMMGGLAMCLAAVAFALHPALAVADKIRAVSMQ